MNKAFEFGSWYKTPEEEMKFLYYTSQMTTGKASFGWYGTVQDRTELKNQELELIATREFYQNVLDNIPVESVLIDENGKYFYISKNAIGDGQLRQFLVGKNNVDYAEYRNLETSFAELRDEKFKEALQGELTVRWEEKNENARRKRYLPHSQPCSLALERRTIGQEILDRVFVRYQ